MNIWLLKWGNQISQDTISCIEIPTCQMVERQVQRLQIAAVGPMHWQRSCDGAEDSSERFLALHWDYTFNTQSILCQPFHFLVPPGTCACTHADQTFLLKEGIQRLTRSCQTSVATFSWCPVLNARIVLVQVQATLWLLLTKNQAGTEGHKQSG